jgi:2-phospho-L-lactate guanylyltransferase
VVSPDPVLLAWAEGIGAWPLLQPDHGLNAGLEYARHTLLARQQWSALLVMLPDLPLITAADVTALTELSRPDTAVIAADRHGSGTNALLLQPADGLSFAFGAHSLQRHIAAAQTRGWSIRRYDGPRMAFDLDTADDLRALADVEVEYRL